MRSPLRHRHQIRSWSQPPADQRDAEPDLREPYASLVLTVNDVLVKRVVAVRTSLADFLREDLGLTGTHLGCEHGVCGACTVLADGRTTRSCLTLAVQMQGCSVTTIEGLTENRIGAQAQRALGARRGLQCGFCTPGVVMTLVELLDDCRDRHRVGDRLDEEVVRSRLSGNLCRCTGYEGIVDAALDLCRQFCRSGDDDERTRTQD